MSAIELQNDTVLPTNSTKDATLFLKTIEEGQILQRSYFWMRIYDGPLFCAIFEEDSTKFLPSWVSQEHISRHLFGDAGVKALKRAENYHGKYFLWATEFSNVHAHFDFNEPHITIGGIEYAGAEQYYQAQKFFGTSNQNLCGVLAKISSPTEAFQMGNRGAHLRSDWDEVKFEVMRKAVMAKFHATRYLNNLLAQTKGHLLVQIKPQDSVWGTGYDGSGANMLGQILMDVRENALEIQ